MRVSHVATWFQRSILSLSLVNRQLIKTYKTNVYKETNYSYSTAAEILSLPCLPDSRLIHNLRDLEG